MITFLSFADKKYQGTLNRIKNEALSSSFFDVVKTYNEDDLPNDIRNFCIQNNRGYGYWIWKPYLVYKAIKEIKENDILIYCDAGCTINLKGKKRFDEYVEMVKNKPYGNISFQMGHLEKKFTKGDIFEHFKAFDLYDTGQIANCVIILRKNEHTNNLIKIWYETCINEKHLITDSQSKIPNDPTFFDNRHDQSVFSVIRKKYGTILLNDETYILNNNHSNGFDDSYPFQCTRIKF